MNVFISHIHEEASLAEALKQVIETTRVGVEAFVSSQDIRAGQQWLNTLTRELNESEVVLVLCSPRSTQRPWVNFEAGIGSEGGRRVIPVCHSGTKAADLGHPLSVFDAVDLYNAGHLEHLLESISDERPSIENTDSLWRSVERSIDSIDYTPRALQPIPPPSDPAMEILFDLSHGQEGWRSNESIFQLVEPRGGPAPRNHAARTLRAVDSADQLRSADLKPWRGLVVATPWQAHTVPETIQQLVGWVRDGGRLLLMGFELGDWHHEANLNALAGHFGIHFEANIVAPTGYDRKPKPYGEAIDFDLDRTGGEHDVFAGLEHVQWVNVQTISTDPGAISLITVGDNPVAYPDPKTVAYPNLMLTMPVDKVVLRTDPEASVAVLAAGDLTGRGDVIALGTWELLGEEADDSFESNRRLFDNLLRWLTEERPVGPP